MYSERNFILYNLPLVPFPDKTYSGVSTSRIELSSSSTSALESKATTSSLGIELHSNKQRAWGDILTACSRRASSIRPFGVQAGKDRFLKNMPHTIKLPIKTPKMNKAIRRGKFMLQM